MQPKYQLLPPLSQEEYERLKADIQLRGIMVPVEIDEDGNILDGHNRAQIANQLGIDYPIVTRTGLPEHEKRLHAVTLNLARRHLTDGQKTLVGRTIEPDIAERARLRMAAGGAKAAPGRPIGKGMENFPDLIQQTTTRDEVAAEVGIGTGRTYENHKRVIEQAEELAEESLEIADALESLEAGEIDIPQLKKAIKPHVSHNSGENEWYTPIKFLDAARRVMGGIDLDPATSQLAQTNVQAKKFFTKEDDGLSKLWKGKVWMNPPYAQPLIGQFAEKLALHVQQGDVTQAIVLVNNGTETQWAQTLLAEAEAVCFPASRIKFIDANGNPSGAPLQGQMFIYVGNKAKAERFISEFEEFGICLRRGAENG